MAREHVSTAETSTLHPAVSCCVKEIVINDVPVTVFVDTGASSCTIQESVVREHGMTVVEQKCAITSFGEDKNLTYSFGYLDATVTLNAVTIDGLKIRVVPDGAQPWSAMIGRTFTDHPAVFHFAIEGVMYFEYRDQLLGSLTRYLEHNPVAPPVEIYST